MLRDVTFWLTFATALLLVLLIGGLLSASLQQCPAFGKLLLISVGAALLSGTAAYYLLSMRSSSRSEPALTFQEPAAQPDIEQIRNTVASLKQRLASLSE